MAIIVDVDGNKVTGTKKKDIINWQSSSDWRQPLIVKAKAGNDIIDFSKSAFNKNKLYGEAGKDNIIGSMKNDIVYGGSGNDTLFGLSGDDSIHAGKGYDLVDGGSGKDKIWCDSGINAVSGGNKNDTIYGGVGYDAIAGGTGHDVIKLQEGSKDYKSKTITLGKKPITLTENLRTFVLAGSGNDKIYNIYGGAMIYGEDGDDTISAVTGNNTLYGGGGYDSITGGNRNDYIDGGACADTLKGGKGNDTIKGGVADDSIEGGAGHDVIYGGTGKDVIKGGDGNDKICGDSGNDTINAGPRYNKIYFNAGDSQNLIISGGGHDTLIFKEGAYDTFSAKWDGNDLVLKGHNNEKDINVHARLQNFGDGNHSVEKVILGNEEHSIDEFVPVKDSSLNSINAVRVAWQTAGGASDVSGVAITATRNDLPPLVSAYLG